MRGVLVAGADYGNRKAATVASEVVSAANKLIDSGHTVLHFTGVDDPRAGMHNAPRDSFQQILVLGQRPSSVDAKVEML